MGEMKAVPIRFEAAEYERLRRQSFDEKRSMAEIVRKALNEKWERESEMEKYEERTKTNWKEIILVDGEGDEVRYDLRNDEFLKALRQYRKTGTIDGYFFEQGWGPKSPDVIDWAEFPEEG